MDDKGKPVFKTADKVVTKEDKANKEIPLARQHLRRRPHTPILQKDDKGKLEARSEHGKAIPEPFTISYAPADAVSGTAGTKNAKGEVATDPVNGPETFNYHPTGASVILPHSFNYTVIQACIAILILVGFESVTSMGEEAKNAKRDIPRAVLLSLLIQGVVCYLIEYFAANYFLNKGYGLTNAAGSGAPIGDMMLITGASMFGSAGAAKAYMLTQAFTVFLALIGTTLSCMATGARVTYAMGRDNEVPSHFGMLHGKNLTPHRAIWTLAAISAVVGVFTVIYYLCGPQATDAMDTRLGPSLKDNPSFSLWYPKWLVFTKSWAAGFPNSVLVITLVSNFGTFMLYMLTCIVAIVAFVEHHTFNGFKHFVVPIFGLFANLGMHVVLHRRPELRGRHEFQGTACGLGRCRGVGSLWAQAISCLPA